ncbi:MAG: NAD-glutamate dehydrogenase [Immundisolibacterales bacterium]|nr:NAD-glutamate dehydrogenase [Immundisolibacterales bacterium]
MATTGDAAAATEAGRWRGELAGMLAERFGAEAGASLRSRYERVFGSGYRGRYGPDGALRDIEITEALAGRKDEVSVLPPAAAEDGEPPRGPLETDLLRPPGSDPRFFRFKIFHLGGPVHLSDSLPMLENMGVRVEDEHPRVLRPAGEDGEAVWLHDFGLRQRGAGAAADLDSAGDAFRECFARVWAGAAEDDGFNRLALAPGLDWREIALLRAYARYLRQVRFSLSQSYIEDTLFANPGIARDLVRLFHARFDPAGPSAGGAGADGAEAAGAACDAAPSDGDPPYAIAERILGGLEAVASLDEDRILRTYLELVDGTLRTNYYQRGPDGRRRPCLALKLDPSCVHEMPEPRPRFEIFVYSPRLEGVHLRGGPIARGGIRWSDRREDFRTEVLGLLKTQMVKNAVIVPVGSKGGYVLKRPPADRAALAEEGVACYREFIGALLELTDNYDYPAKGAGGSAGSEITPPPDTVRHDGPDPYLVVAADKGTATFSDTANELSAAAGFWLGDAFASGGSDGYDHKGIGITARGAWESVKSHFRVLGLDPARDPFTAAGIGDMSGDVFGNGMRCSRRIRLVAAFSHLHVFIDPDPDPEASFAERERLFRLPGSTWADYRAELVSRGGGVWPRSAKSITLSPEAMAALGIAGGAAARTPNDVIRAILRAPVDLLWNGGIGTYVKSSGETHAQVGDRSNDPVRINARELRCRVVGEGGNLGFTQAARIEYARAGGLVNTDAIDNSGGVDCSDHEVNIKILLDAAVRDGALDPAERSGLLHAMTDEVADGVLRNNYLQNVGLAVARTQAAPLVEVHARFIEHLERSVALDRAGEGLPDRDEIAERRRAGEGLAGPELAVLVAYAKLDLFDALIGSDLPEDPEMAAELAAYFPLTLRERFAAAIPGHRLAREIISTLAANETVNRAGITFAFRVSDEIGAAPEDAVRAWFALRGLYRLPELFEAVEGAGLAAAAHVAAVLEIRKLMDRGARWLLRNAPRPLSVTSVVERYREGVRMASALIPELASEAVRGEIRAARDKLVEAQVPAALAERLAVCSELPSALDITEVAWRCFVPGGGVGERTTIADSGIERAARAWYGVDALLDVGWLQARIAALPRADRWQALARGALRGDLLRRHRVLAAGVLREGAGARPDAALRAWRNSNARAIQRWSELVANLKAEPQVEYPMMAVALRELREVARGGSAGAVGGPGSALR